MNDPAPFPKQSDTLKLRAKARPVARLNRKVLLAGAGIGALLLFVAASIALHPPSLAGEAEARELYNTTTRRTPDGLASLPASYAVWQPAPNVPLLGAPQTGDLGGAVVAEEDRWGIGRDWNVTPDGDFRPSREDEVLRARRLAEAKLADQAGKAGVFFELSGVSGNRPAPAGGPPPSFGRELLALAAQGSGSPPAGQGEPDANFQSRKLAFAASEPNASIYNPYTVETPASPWQVMAGTLIPASLVTGINSDLPGTVIAQVTQPVYDTVSGTTLLIPQGARLLGRYQSEISFGQDRALIVWDRILFPDGSSIRISEPGTDASGASGISDRTDHHWGRVFAAAGLATLLGIGTELGPDSDDDIVRAIRRGGAGTVNMAGQRVVDRNLGIQPTIRVRPGWPVRVLVTRDLILRPYREGDIR